MALVTFHKLRRIDKMTQTKFTTALFAVSLSLIFGLPGRAFASANAGAPAQGQAAPSGNSNSIYGTWLQKLDSADGSTHITAYFTFAADHISVRNECRVGGVFGTTMVAELTVSGDTTPDGKFSNFTLPAEDQGHTATRIGSITNRCNAEFNPNADRRLVVQGNTMFVYNSTGQMVRKASGEPYAYTRAN